MWENTFTGTTAADKFGIFRLAINERLIDDVILVTVAMVLSFGFSRSSCVRMQIIFVPAGEHTYAHKVTRRAVRLTRANHSTRPADRSSGRARQVRIIIFSPSSASHAEQVPLHGTAGS